MDQSRPGWRQSGSADETPHDLNKSTMMGHSPHDAERDLSVHRGPQATIGLLDLPPEVRHQIYKYLFCHKPTPLPLARKLYEISVIFNIRTPEAERLEPIFYTEIFRVNKAISCDTLRFAYSSNAFRLMSDLTTFCGLGSIALASIKTLTVFNNCWTSGSHTHLIWDILSRRCHNLETLVAQLPSHLSFQVIPWLKDFVAATPCDQKPPRLVLTLYIWERHYSFEYPEREYRQTLQELNGQLGAESWEGYMNPLDIVMNFPRHVQRIELVHDVSPMAIQAIDDFLEARPDVRLTRTDEVYSETGYQRPGQRRQIRYVWNHND